MTDRMIVRKDGNVGWMVFNNPARHNALSLEMWSAIADIVADFEADPEVRIIVMTGAGEKAFVSGADISEFEKQRSTAEAAAAYDAASEKAVAAVRTADKPTIAMIRGYCMGGGVGIALQCDLRIAAEGARFGVPAAKLGLGYKVTGIKDLVDIVGPAFAKEIMFTGRQFDAAEAHAMGLVNRVVPAGELEAYVTEYAQTIAGNAPLTVRASKMSVDAVVRGADHGRMAKVHGAIDACILSEDYAEGRRAFGEKRKPVFTGR
jgi:enoyl-CoA hydratase/carnithine racemase